MQGEASWSRRSPSPSSVHAHAWVSSCTAALLHMDLLLCSPFLRQVSVLTDGDLLPPAMSSLTRAVCRVSPHFPLWAVGPRPVRSPCACYSTGTGENAEKGVLAERPEEQTELAERSAPVPEWVQKLQVCP